jgi:hypothetical protein
MSSTTPTPTPTACSQGSADSASCISVMINSRRSRSLFISYRTTYEQLNDLGATKSPGSTVRRLTLMFIGCLLTVVIVVAMIFVLSHVIEPHRQRRRSLATSPIDSGHYSTNLPGRCQQFLQTISSNMFGKRRRLNFFSISNHGQSSAHHRQGETSRTHLSENPDEALLFDDPYADGGLNGSSTNPYKSLTLSVT